MGKVCAQRERLVVWEVVVDGRVAAMYFTRRLARQGAAVRRRLGGDWLVGVRRREWVELARVVNP